MLLLSCTASARAPQVVTTPACQQFAQAQGARMQNVDHAGSVLCKAVAAPSSLRSLHQVRSVSTLSFVTVRLPLTIDCKHLFISLRLNPWVSEPYRLCTCFIKIIWILSGLGKANPTLCCLPSTDLQSFFARCIAHNSSHGSTTFCLKRAATAAD
jgi:hypothetical protein